MIRGKNSIMTKPQNESEVDPVCKGAWGVL